MPPDRVLAVDLGGTQMRAAVVDGDGRVSRRHARPTPHEDSDVSALIDLARASLADGISTAVIAVPGRVDYTSVRLERAPNLPVHWKDMLRADYLSDRLDLSVRLANDADAGAVGETYFGAGRDRQDVAYVTVSTGVGAGVLLGRKLVRGRRSGGEVGHTLIEPFGASGKEPATVEERASGTTLDREATTLDMADGAALLEAFTSGDRDAHNVWERVVAVLGVAVVNIAHLFAPEMIVIGGGLGLNAGSLLLDPLADLVHTYGPVDLPCPIEFATAALGDDSVLAGCGAWLRATAEWGMPSPLATGGRPPEGTAPDR